MTTPYKRASAETEILVRTPLTTPEGRLNQDAVGFARRPLIDTGGIDGRRAWGRNKRWEYWCVMTPEHIIALTVSSLDYAGVHEVWVFDRATRTSVSQSAVVPFAKNVVLPPSLGDGPARARAKNLRIDIAPEPRGTRLRATIPGAHIDIVVAEPQDHECLAVVVPWSESRFQYTVKDVARPASGIVRLDGIVHTISSGWGVLDHGRGRWPYDVRWNWGAGSGVSDGHEIGVQIGGQWTVGTGSTENALLVDGVLHKIGDELTWEFDPQNYLSPWRMRGGRLDLLFEPFYDKVSRTNLGIVSSSTHQCFGYYSGTFTTAKGERVELSGIEGWAENVHNRW